MKLVKKVLIGLAIFLVVLIAAAAILPMVFKNDIKAAIDREIAKNVNADVIFDVDNFSLTIFRNFPNITVQIKELGVFNRAPFEGEHLFVVDRLDVEVNLSDVVFGSQLRLKGITMERPQVNVKVLPDGRANYDIVIPSTDTVVTTDGPSDFSFGIDHWEIIDGDVAYNDQSIPYFLTLNGLNHNGSGDFSQDLFDLKTHTVADTVTTSMGTMEFLKNKRVEIDAIIGISNNFSTYTFKENSILVNDFGMNFDGSVTMNPNGYGMDITFKSPANSFKSLLSLVPGMYTRDYKTIETRGDLAFAGFVKGTYTEKQMPAFQLNLQVKDAMFKYPDLPTAVNNINMDLMVDNKDGIINNTVVNLKKLHLDFGNNPVDASLLIQNLKNYRLDAKVDAKLNLAELSKMFPMKDLEMRGLFAVNASAKGVYDSVKKVIPDVHGYMTLKDGYFKTPTMSVTLSEANTSFDPGKIILKKLDGSLGKSDFKVTGQLENYVAYALRKQTVRGTITFSSTLLDLNEFMTEDESPAAADTSSFGVIPIPKNIDFTLKSSIGTVKMMDYTMINASGDIILRDGIANMSGLKFGMLGGSFMVNGTYTANDIKHPKYDLDLKIEKLSIQEAAHSFSIIKTYAPIAGLVNGNFGTDFKLNGELTPQMTPNLATVNGAGLIKIAQASLTKSSLVAGVTSLTQLKNSDNVSLKDVLMSASIDNGRFSVKPFNISMGNVPATLSGSTGLDLSIDYQLKMMVPAGQLGSQFQGTLNQWTGSKHPTDKIPVTIGIGGTVKDPKPKLIATEQKQQVKEAAKAVVTQKTQEAAKQLLGGAKPADVLKGLTSKPATTTTPATDTTKPSQTNPLLRKKKKN